MLSLLLLVLSAFVFSPDSPSSDGELWLCTCQEPLSGTTAYQYIYMVRAETPVACRTDQPLSNYSGFRETRRRNQALTWTVDGRRKMSAVKAQRRGLRRSDTKVMAVPVAEFPELVQAYYSELPER